MVLNIKPLVLMILLISFLGCSSSRSNTTYRLPSHVPPSKTSSGTPNDAGGTRYAATQRPYKVAGVKYHPIHDASGFVQVGKASWYGRKFHGRKTSNGETYDMYDMTAAHKTLPMNTWVSVHNLENGRKIVVRINDRGPFVAGRIIDLSYTGAKRLGIVGPGTAKVTVTALGQAVSYSPKTKDPVSFKAVDYYKGNFTVQVGAFKIKQNAQAYREKLSRAYDNAHIAAARTDQGLYYRVRIGRFTKLEDAEKYSKELALRGFGTTFAVAEE